MKDPYEVLEIPRGSDKDTIKKAYRKLAKKWHPDLHEKEKKEEATEKFKEVNAAYEQLENPNKYTQYRSNPFTNPMDDIFSSFFGRRQQRRPVGEHIVLECYVTLEDVLNGNTFELKYARNKICQSCFGVGGVEINCKHCDGNGKKVIYGSAMTVQTTCHACSGTGKCIDIKCEKCEGGFLADEEKIIQFDLKKGVENNSQISFLGMGHPSKDEMGTSGNLYIIVRYKEHDLFSAYDNGDLLYKAKVFYTQLMLGSEIKVPTLEGDVSFVIPKNTSPGQKFKLKELGLPRFSNRTGGIYNRGDQFVQIQLEFPEILDDKHKKLIDELSQIENELRQTRSKNG